MSWGRRGGLCLCALVAAVAAAPAPAQRGLAIDASPEAANPRALGDVVTWQHLRESPNGAITATRYRRVAGRTLRADGRPSQSAAFGDLGRDAAGRVVQVLGGDDGYLTAPDVQPEVTPAPFRGWLYDVRTGRARRGPWPDLGVDCRAATAAVWYHRTAMALACRPLDGAIVVFDGAAQRPLMKLPRLGRFAWTRVRLDVSGDGVAAGIERKACAKDEEGSGQCVVTTGPADLTYETWWFRTGCAPRLLGRSRTRVYDPPQIEGGSIYWLEGVWDFESGGPHRALLIRRAILPGCGVGRVQTLWRSTFRQQIGVAVAGRQMYVTRDQDGLRLFPLG